MRNPPSKPDFSTLSSQQFGDYFDQRVHALLATIEASEPYQSVFAPNADARKRDLHLFTGLSAV